MSDPRPLTERIERLLAEYNEWYKECEEAEYTDSGDAQEFLSAMEQLLLEPVDALGPPGGVA